MIRGRKETKNYATWFIGFDHEVDLTSQLLTSRHKSDVNSRHLPRSTSLDVLPKTNLIKTQSLETLSRDPLQRHSVWDLPIRDPNKVLEVNVSKLQKKDVQNGSSTILQTKDIYREAFENTRKAEEQKFRVKFDSLLDDLRQALDSQTSSGISSIHDSTSYGEIMVSYRKRIRELLSVLSQRLQLAVENYLEEESSANVSQKVKQIVSRLVEDQLGESVDLTSDEAVSDLSSLSDESTEVHQCYEDQLAQAVVSKVIENQRREGMLNPQERVQEILEATNALTEASQVPQSPDDTAAKIFAELKSYTNSLPGRKLPKPLQVEEIVIPYEPPIEKKFVNRVKSPSQTPSLNLTSRDLTDRSRCTLPNLDELNFESNEIDPDLLSLNLTPIKEVDEEIEDMIDLSAGNSLNWHQNWILRDLSSKKRVEEISQNHPVLVPQPEEVLSPRIGNKDADELSDLSENDELERDVGSSLSGEGEFSHSNEDLAEKEPKSLIELFSPVETISANPPTPPLETSSPLKTSDAEDSYSSIPDKQSTTSQMPVTNVNPEPVIKSIPSEEGDPKFEIPPESQRIAEGEAVKWQCHVSGTEPIDIFWFRIESEVHELEEDEKYEMTKDTNKHTLTIHYPSKTEAGQYMCIAVNEKGKCSEYFILNIEDNTQPIKAPEFLKSPKDVEVTEGQMVKFRCKVKGYPPPRITWYKDGKLLKGNSSCKLEKFGNRDYLLTIEYATMDDDAEYSVLAKNIGGESRAMAQLLVEPLESMESDSINSLRARLSFSSNTPSTAPSESPPERSSPIMLQSQMEENAAANKDLHIQNLSRKMTRTKDGVSDVAEELLQSADEMSLIQQHLDFMDHTLNKLEVNINQDLTKDTSNDQDSLNNNEEPRIDDLFAHQVLAEYHVQDPVTCRKNDTEKMTEEEVLKEDEVEDAVTVDDELVVDDMFTHRVLDEHRQQKAAAENMRKVTTSALAILQSAEDALARERKDSQNNVILAEQEMEEVFGQHKTNELSICKDSKMVASEETSLNIGLTPETDKKNPFSANENILVGIGCASPIEDKVSNLSAAEKLNFGPKPIDHKRFSRDFYVNSPLVISKNSSSKKAKEVAETEDEIYIAANGVYSLEDKIQQLEAQVENIHEGMSEKSMSDLEDEVAKTVAQVEHSEHQVASLESSVDQLQRVTECLPSLSPRQSVDSGVSSTKEQFHVPRILIGQSSEEEVPESRSEFDADSGIGMPSVTQLKAMFNQPKDTPGDASVKRTKLTFTPIHSITARSLSKIQMEEIQKQQTEEAKKQTIGLDGRPVERHRPSLKTIPAPQPPGGLSQNNPTRRRAPLAPPLRDIEAESGGMDKTPRIKKGCIAARAAFWEKLTQQGGMSEQDEKTDFPELLEENGA